MHKLHIPVMGTGFSIDTPIRVAHFGISSVMSIMDDVLIEKVREHYCNKFNLDFSPITRWSEDSRARRITAYIDTVIEIVQIQNQAPMRLLKTREEILLEQYRLLTLLRKASVGRVTPRSKQINKIHHPVSRLKAHRLS